MVVAVQIPNRIFNFRQKKSILAINILKFFPETKSK